MPWGPHRLRGLAPFSGYREFLPSGLSLADYVVREPVLARLAAEDRLFWYNLHTEPGHLRRPEAPVTLKRGFSASAVVEWLAEAGVGVMAADVMRVALQIWPMPTSWPPSKPH